jgi:hypothetical protein
MEMRKSDGVLIYGLLLFDEFILGSLLPVIKCGNGL